MNWMLYASVAVLLFAAERMYLWVATRFNIVDRPNHRSSHTRLTVRGGGVIFWLAALLAFLVTDLATPYFFAGLTAVALISFLDDVNSISNRVRLLVQLVGMALLMGQAGFWPEWWMVFALIVGCGVLNAYNFMDGINGITAFYSFVTVTTLSIINQGFTFFVAPVLPGFVLLSLVVFSFFNARRSALCFAGDVGSVSMAFIIIFLLGILMRKTGLLTYGLLLTVYGIDSVMTILYRLWRGENIFQPHKLHLFQLLVHRLRWPHLRVAGLYAFAQALINVLVIGLAQQNVSTQWIGGAGLVAVLTLFYWLIKKALLKTESPAPVVAPVPPR
ncbi:UDP-GlcNAc--UDP-phosphate GlcNAc-1-phosphate transferase [Larkinella sp. VNQ87]|uniref:UDP-GlcNAc--UDP-phosphate GlcNAc-1-phosphate transferase n=1 Tax=Larkinella sp. VNQ87 TaxID=3400921 RepID=UPI003C071ED7